MKKNLVVNNDIDTMSLLKRWLEKRDYLVKFTGSQEKAFSILKKFTPELVIVDVLQKDVAIELKSHNRTQSIPILLMTGYTLRGSNSKVPADDIIEKPFNLSLLEQKIEKLMNGVVAH